MYNRNNIQIIQSAKPWLQSLPKTTPDACLWHYASCSLYGHKKVYPLHMCLPFRMASKRKHITLYIEDKLDVFKSLESGIWWQLSQISILLDKLQFQILNKIMVSCYGMLWQHNKTNNAEIKWCLYMVPKGKQVHISYIKLCF